MFKFLKGRKAKKKLDASNKENTSRHQPRQSHGSDDDSDEESTNVSLGKLSVHSDSDDGDTSHHKSPTITTKSPTKPSPLSPPSAASSHQDSNNHHHQYQQSKLQQRLATEQERDAANKEQLPPYFTVDRTARTLATVQQYTDIHAHDAQLFGHTVRQQVQALEGQIDEIKPCNKIVNLGQFDAPWIITPQPQAEKRNVEKQRVFIHGIYSTLYVRGVGRLIEPDRAADKQHEPYTPTSTQTNEHLLLYCSLELPALLKQNKVTDFTANCIVLTDKRLLQLNGGDVVHECAYGLNSGNTFKVVRNKNLDDADSDATVQLTIQVRSQLATDDNTGDENVRPGKSSKSNMTFDLPSSEVYAYLTEYMQVTHQLQHHQIALAFHSNQQQYNAQRTYSDHIIKGWTVLLKSFAGPAIFSPVKMVLYQNLIKQALINTREMINTNKQLNIHIKAIKLLNFYVPTIEPIDVNDGDVQFDADGLPIDSNGTIIPDQIPALVLRGFKFAPYHEYLFDVHWALHEFNATVLITGKKLFKFKLELTLSDLDLRGTLRLRTNPYEAEQISVSFVSTPVVNFRITSHMTVSTTTLPHSWQSKITKLIQDKVETSINKLISDKLGADQWVNIAMSKSQLLMLLDKWNSVCRYPFMFDGTDDVDMMAYSLAQTTQAEMELSETCNAMRALREKLTRFVNLNEPTAEQVQQL